MPWWFVAVLHDLEASRDFGAHLHNGDPLTHRTVNVPRNRPPGNPPFTFEESARDALTFEGFAHVADWSISHALFRFERFNGFGYRNPSIDIPSPYLWSFSQHYTRGKFSSDGHFEPTLVSQQCGAGVLLRALVDGGHVVPLDDGGRRVRARLTAPADDPPRRPRTPRAAPRSRTRTPRSATAR